MFGSVSNLFQKDKFPQSPTSSTETSSQAPVGPAHAHTPQVSSQPLGPVSSTHAAAARDLVVLPWELLGQRG